MPVPRTCDCGTCKKCLHRQRNAQWRKQNPEVHRERVRNSHFKNIERLYGITPEQYAILLEAQDGKCAICREVDPVRNRLSVDHDHKTGRVRGLLCMRCNGGIGMLGDSIERLENAIRYLQLWGI